ncbi:MAG: hypothetical protein HOP19_23230, partial [Acidobacteria bacterium]|nr:hypothetical protein [Acidobacteriota bacterium]
MIAFSLSAFLFVFWGFIGLPVLRVFYTQRNLLQNLLLAPAMGVATLLLPIFWLNHAGLPIGKFAIPLTVGICLMQGAVWVWLRPIVPLKKYLPFLGILLLALFLTGRPMLLYGFDWASYCNGDMATYVLSADRLLNHGFFDSPDAETLASGREYSLGLWFLSVVAGHRSGTEMIIAWAVKLTGISGPNIYMPLLLSLHLVMISAAAGLVLQGRRFRLASLLTVFLLGISALATLGTTYQLMPQVIGISFLSCCTALLLRPFNELRRRNLIKHGVVAGFMIAALFTVYPEVSPFLFLAYGIYVVARFLQKNSQRKLIAKSYFSSGATALSAWLILLNNYW